MSKQQGKFSTIICSSPHVKTAFSIHPPTRYWWNIILRLHGKPTDSHLSPQERVYCIAGGFRFYAWLYRLLAIIFLILAPALVALNVADNTNASTYWGMASFLAGIYLWNVSGLGYAGAKSYLQRQPQSISTLASFMVMIVAFLSLFVAAVSVLAHQMEWVATWPNLLGATLLFIFGIGSYMIEVIYLVTQDGFESHTTDAGL